MRAVLASLCLVLLLVAITGCGPVAEETAEAPVASATDTAIGRIDSPGEAGPLAADAASLQETTPFPDLDGESVLRTYELRIVNRMRMDLFVYVSAGADRVTLDTVPGRDSVRVNVRVRGREVRLDAEDQNGRTIRSATLELAPATSNRWEIVESGL